MAAFLQGLVAGAATAGSRRIQEERAAKIEQQRIRFAAIEKESAKAAAARAKRLIEIREYLEPRNISDANQAQAEQKTTEAFMLADKVGEANTGKVFSNLDRFLSGLGEPAVEAVAPPGFVPQAPQPVQPPGTTPPIVPIPGVPEAPAGVPQVAPPQAIPGVTPAPQPAPSLVPGIVGRPPEEPEGLLAGIEGEGPIQKAALVNARVRSVFSAAGFDPEKIATSTTDPQTGAFTVTFKSEATTSKFNAMLEQSANAARINPRELPDTQALRGVEVIKQLEEKVINPLLEEDATPEELFTLNSELVAAQKRNDFATARYLSSVAGPAILGKIDALLTAPPVEDEEETVVGDLQDATVSLSDIEVNDKIEQLDPGVAFIVRKLKEGEPEFTSDLLDSALSTLTDPRDIARNVKLINELGLPKNTAEFDVSGLKGNRDKRLGRQVLHRVGAIEQQLFKTPTARELFASDNTENFAVKGLLRSIGVLNQRDPESMNVLLEQLGDDQQILIENYLRSFNEFRSEFAKGLMKEPEEVPEGIAVPLGEVTEEILPELPEEVTFQTVEAPITEEPLPTQAPELTEEDLTLLPKEEQIKKALVSLQDTPEFKEFKTLRGKGRPTTGETLEEATTIVTDIQTPEERQRFQELQTIVFEKLKDLIPDLTPQDLAVFGGI